jgi:hypothetical protein
VVIRAVRRTALALFALSTGCSAILGFHDGTAARGVEGDPCDDGTRASCAAGLTCQLAHCMPVTCADASCAPDSGGGPTSTVVTSFIGEPGGLVALTGYVYYTRDNGVYGCSATQPCDVEQVMYSQPIDPRPRVISAYGSLVAWADPVAGKLSYCYFGMLNRCNSALTLDERGVRALATDLSTGELYLVNAGSGTGQSSDLRVYARDSAVTTRTVATLPSTSGLVSVVADGSQRQFVQIGRTAYSVVTPVGADAGPSVVNALASEDAGLPAPATAAILVASRRVIWTRAADEGDGLSQCPIAEGEIACDPATIKPFAAAGDAVTAAASTANMVVWARLRGTSSDVYFCKPTPSDFSERACTPTLLVGDRVGRISALTIEPSPVGPDNPTKRVFFVLTEPGSGRVSIERATLP